MSEPVLAIVAGGGLVAEVRAAMQRRGLSQAAAAREIGVSPAALSQWLSGTYGGDSAAIAAKAARWLEAGTARGALLERLPEAPAWVATSTAARIHAALTQAQIAPEIAVVFGGAGAGKTVAARRYAATRPNVGLVEASPATRALGPCLERVAGAVGARPSSSRPAAVEAALLDRLVGTRGLIVVDEAQHLSLRALDGLRSLHDRGEVGLALLGGEPLYTRLHGRRAAETAQLTSRIGRRVRLSQTAAGDAEALLGAWDEIEIEAPAKRRAVEIANRPGGLRALVKSMRLAALYARGEAVGERHVTAAWRDLGGGSD